jgi:hypothetical protein
MFGFAIYQILSREGKAARSTAATEGSKGPKVDAERAPLLIQGNDQYE